MRYIFKSAKMYAFVISELAVAHITVILDDFTNMFGRQILVRYQNPSVTTIDSPTHLFAHINKTTFSLLPVSLLLHLNPLLRLVRKDLGRHGAGSSAH